MQTNLEQEPEWYILNGLVWEVQYPGVNELIDAYYQYSTQPDSDNNFEVDFQVSLGGVNKEIKTLTLHQDCFERGYGYVGDVYTSDGEVLPLYRYHTMMDKY